jgi:hypothetical protein
MYLIVLFLLVVIGFIANETHLRVKAMQAEIDILRRLTANLSEKAEGRQ